MMAPRTQTRRSFVRGSAIATGGLGLGLGACVGAAGTTSDGRRIVDLQLGWLAGANQVGEVVAAQQGFFDAEGIALRIRPGGPNIDGVAIVASGRYLVGAATSSPSVMFAVSQGIPVRCFAVAMQEHPYAYFSLPGNPVREPAELVGKRVGIQPTGQVLLDALLARHQIEADEVQVQIVGSSLVPLLTGQVDAITGWTTNVAALRPLGDQRVTMRLWDVGIRLYAWPYYATAQALQEDAPVLESFLRAAGRGWRFVHDDPEAAVRILTRTFPVLRFEDELQATLEQMPYVFNNRTAEFGWGTMALETWEDQLTTYDRLGQFSRGAPSVDDLMTSAVLDATSDARPRLGATP